MMRGASIQQKKMRSGSSDLAEIQATQNSYKAMLDRALAKLDSEPSVAKGDVDGYASEKRKPKR